MRSGCLLVCYRPLAFSIQTYPGGRNLGSSTASGSPERAIATRPCATPGPPCTSCTSCAACRSTRSARTPRRRKVCRRNSRRASCLRFAGPARRAPTCAGRRARPRAGACATAWQQRAGVRRSRAGRPRRPLRRPWRLELHFRVVLGRARRRGLKPLTVQISINGKIRAIAEMLTRSQRNTNVPSGPERSPRVFLRGLSPDEQSRVG